ncbi:MAG: VWA domain-containing protein [Gammaproteobacteria bacterium]|nr:VWA domain-containing protein [Gammaproteobacteria bacterium]
MKNKILAIGLFVITAVVVGFYPFIQKTAVANVNLNITEKPKIQLAILLDTSSSMNGLLDQTRNQLWQVVNEFSKAERDGVKPTLEVAVYEYGNSRLSSDTGFIRQVSGLTGELDEVSEALFSLTTNGGSEYCGYAIKTAVTDLPWSKSDGDIKAIFIAGNEPFTQGPVSYKQAIALAKQKGITINTIHAGNKQQGANSGWKDGALLAGGEYMSIDHNHKIAHINAPQDNQIAILNEKLNKTYVPYGAKGRAKARRQREQDKKSKSISSALLSKRVQAKASAMYDNSKWDLVDALETGKVELDKIEERELPAELRKMSKGKRKDYIENMVNERKEIKKQIGRLSQERSKYVAGRKKEMNAPSVATMDQAITSAVQKQGGAKKFVF